jgi:simple sugar transport system ATP-binding protein
MPPAGHNDAMIAPAGGPARLSLAGITKAYPTVVANDAIDLAVAPGEIHAVLGENGAGKSTLMKVIYGVVRPDAGTIHWNGEPVVIASPARARKLGIAMVFQHFSLFETLTVAENILLAQDAARPPADLFARVRAISQRYGLPLDPGRPVHTLSVAERQRVEIIRSLLLSPSLLIMDEPTSVLTPQAVTNLFHTLRTLAAEGCSILYISHKLDEIRTLCDRATVLRGGRVTGECDPRAETPASLARMMIGGDLPHPHHRKSRAQGAPRLAVERLSLSAGDSFGTALADVSFSVHAGEILGIAGISGNGQRELVAALSGERPLGAEVPERAIVIDGTAVAALTARERRAHGLAFVPEERLPRGAVPEMSLAENTLLTARGRPLVRRGFIRERALADFTAATIAQFGVKAAGPGAAAQSLSGGNLQKFIVGREIRQRPNVYIAAQPTWGLDVAAAAQVRQALIDLRDEGVAVLVVSDDIDELFEICDSIAVIANGRLSEKRAARDTNAEAIGLLMGGSSGVDAARADVTADPA